MFKRFWKTSLAVLLIVVFQVSAAAAWEIKVEYVAGYIAYAAEEFRFDAGTGDITVFTGNRKLDISDSQSTAKIIGYLKDLGGKYHKIGEVTIKKGDENRCVGFYGSALAPTFERCAESTW